MKLITVRVPATTRRHLLESTGMIPHIKHFHCEAVEFLKFDQMKRIIQIVEDDEDIRSILEIILEDANFTVETFGNVTSFKNRRRQQVDLILLDVMLPDGNGIDLSRWLKADAQTCQIPILIMSAHALVNDVLSSTQADGFISKPFDIDVFVSKIQQTLH